MKKMKKRLTGFLALFSVVLVFTTAAFAETGIEKLETQLSLAKGQERITLLKQLADAYTPQSPTKAYEYTKEALELLKEFPDPQQQWLLLNDLSYLSIQLGKYTEALDYAGLSLVLAREMKNKSNLAGSLLRVGEAYRNSNNFDKALENFKQSMQLHRELNDIKGLSRTYNSMGLTYWELGDFPKVLEYYMEALKFDEELGDKKRIGVILQNIGRVYWQLKNDDLALEYYFKAKTLFEEVGEIPGLGMIYNNIAAVYITQKKYPEALTNLEKSLEYKKQTGRQPLVATTLNNIGSLHEETGDFDKAKDYYSQSLAINEEVNNKQGIGLGLLNLGSISRQTRQYAQALRQLNQALAIAREIKKKEFITYSYSTLSQTYADMGDYKKALEYHQKFKDSSDTTFNEQNAKKMADIQKSYEVEKKEREISLLKKDQEIQKLALSRQQSIKDFLIIVSALILLLAFAVYTRYRLRVKVMQRLEREMARRQNAEAELLESRKLESVAILAGGIAHDFNNLLSIILGSLTLAKEKIQLPDTNTPDLLDKAEKASLQAADLIRKFITFSTGDWLEQKEIQPADLLENLEIPNKEMKNIRVVIDLPPGNVKPISGDEKKLHQVLLNLLRNAAEAADGQNPETVTITAHDTILEEENSWQLPPGDYVKISVSDTGKGIPPHLMEKIFDPYFSTKERGSQKGMGLGLSICYGIIKKHHGHISVTSELEKGTTVDIYLPASGGQGLP